MLELLLAPAGRHRTTRRTTARTIRFRLSPRRDSPTASPEEQQAFHNERAQQPQARTRAPRRGSTWGSIFVADEAFFQFVLAGMVGLWVMSSLNPPAAHRRDVTRIRA